MVLGTWTCQKCGYSGEGDCNCKTQFPDDEIVLKPSLEDWQERAKTGEISVKLLEKQLERVSEKDADLRATNKQQLDRLTKMYLENEALKSKLEGVQRELKSAKSKLETNNKDK